ncbi:helix-turn-helix protein [Murinocardiopsis flavida]|uniref:Helix-turn-helix protein n=1 Tax=Murinocardiopsis flavida TaxID=645275 RepID=A0A2P8DEJ1_9ACTN|nr:helix-turn-helix transcriptional regulator [Murinocardiopsis flavida]PSK95654.1 helix-turn-helix protein [Murinocardiopsis flavida]
MEERIRQSEEQTIQTFGSYLREERDNAGQTLRDLAQISGLAQSTLSRWENDRVTPQRADVVKLDRGLQAGGRILAAWELSKSVGFPHWMRDVARLEEAAELIELISPLLVPGLLQSPMYARHVFEESLMGGTSTDLDRRVALRCGRYTQLRKSTEVRVVAVIPLTALTCVPREIRSEQVAHLLGLIETGRVRTHLVPEGSLLVGVTSMLLLFHLRDGGRAAMSDHVDGATLYEDRRSYDRLENLVKNALGYALPPIQSQKVLEELQ